eukprot:403377318
MLKDCEDFLYDIYTSSLQNSQAIQQNQNQINTQKSNNIEEVKQEEAFDYYSYQKLNNQEDFHNQLPTNLVNNDQNKKLLDNAPVLHYVAFKAGMDSIDKEKINRCILEASSGSSYYKREIQRTEAAKIKADQRKAKIKSHQKNERLWKQSSQQAKQIMIDVQKDRDLTRTWMHIDMDMFYAAVEIRDNPELADKPVAIGSYSMVSTANYVARKFGVRSAMPGFIAKKLCPELIFIPNNMKKYSKVSKVFKGILEQYDPNYESLGSDEANLDITDYLNTNNMNDDEGIQKLVFQIREQIFSTTRLTCSAGIACNKMLAKICTDMNKPNGQTYLKPDQQTILDFMKVLSVRKIPGIGRMTELILAQLDIFTLQDVLDKQVQIQIALKERTVYFLFRAALGISRNFHEEEDDDCQKSISISETFRPLVTLEQFKDKISQLCTELAERVDKRKIAGLNISLEIKTTEFSVLQKSLTLKSYIWTQEDLQLYSHQLLEIMWPSKPARLIGVKLSHLKNQHEVKKDRNIGGFFDNKISKEAYQKINEQKLLKLHEEIKKDCIDDIKCTKVKQVDQKQESSPILMNKRGRKPKNLGKIVSEHTDRGDQDVAGKQKMVDIKQMIKESARFAKQERHQKSDLTVIDEDKLGFQFEKDKKDDNDFNSNIKQQNIGKNTSSLKKRGRGRPPKDQKQQHIEKPSLDKYFKKAFK